MLDDKTKSIISKRVALEQLNSAENLGVAITGIIQNAASQGSLGSGSTAIQISKLFRNEASSRIQNIWQTIHRIVTTINLRIDDETTAAISDLLSNLCLEHTQELPAFYIEKTSKHVKGSFLNELSESIQNEINKEVDIQLNELELFSINYQTKVESTGTAIINNYGTAGSIQTGANSVSSINLQTGKLAELQTLLQEMAGEIEELEDLPASLRSQYKEVLNASVQEIDSEKPNSVKLKGLLGALTSGFQQVDATLSGGQKLIEWGQKIGSFLG